MLLLTALVGNISACYNKVYIYSKNKNENENIIMPHSFMFVISPLISVSTKD